MLVIGAGGEKLIKLMDSGYVDYETSDEIVLLEGAPPDIVELFEWYKRIREREIREGVHIF
jgi:hypothetical protein